MPPITVTPEVVSVLGVQGPVDQAVLTARRIGVYTSLAAGAKTDSYRLLAMHGAREASALTRRHLTQALAALDALDQQIG